MASTINQLSGIHKYKLNHKSQRDSPLEVNLTRLCLALEIL